MTRGFSGVAQCGKRNAHLGDWTLRGRWRPWPRLTQPSLWHLVYKPGCGSLLSLLHHIWGIAMLGTTLQRTMELQCCPPLLQPQNAMETSFPSSKHCYRIAVHPILTQTRGVSAGFIEKICIYLNWTINHGFVCNSGPRSKISWLIIIFHIDIRVHPPFGDLKLQLNSGSCHIQTYLNIFKHIYWP